MPVPPNDVWWQLAMGRLIVETGGIPTHDVFSFTQASPGRGLHRSRGREMVRSAAGRGSGR
jgi:hypothetical protein